MQSNVQQTMRACFIAYIVQALVNNFVPLLFVAFQTDYQIPLANITMLITVNFLIQLTVDAVSTGIINRMGYRAAIILAHLFAAIGLISLTVLPEWSPDPFIGLVLAVCIYAIGGGLIEVLVSPMIEACPTDHKEKAMSLLHSFYCWGQVGVVLVSTLFFTIVGIQNWKLLSLLWAVLPIMNLFAFIKAPIYTLPGDETHDPLIQSLFSRKIFWVFMLMMLCAGASEQVVSQWASIFAEQGLGMSKTLGDLAGPMTFAVLMGTSRLLYGKYGEHLDLDRAMQFSCMLCIISYACISLIPHPLIGLLGCAICGFSVGILWPGTFSQASSALSQAGTALFALLALAGDLGCSVGPTLAGFVSSTVHNNLRLEILSAIIFPLMLLAGVLVLANRRRVRRIWLKILKRKPV